MIGEMRVFGQQRSVQIRAVGVPVDAALSLILAIVAMSRQDTPQWLRTGAKIGPPTVVLKAHQRAVFPSQGDVANAARHSLAVMDCLRVEDAHAHKVRTLCWPIEAS